MINEKIKSYTYYAIIVGVLAFSYAAVRFVGAYNSSIEPSAFRSFSVSAEGKVVAIPDVANFTFSVITEGGKEIARSQKENTEKGNKIIEFLKSKKIDSKDIKTQSYSVDPRYEYVNCKADGVCPPPQIVGYTISNTVEVKVRNFDIVGDILGGVVENGANSVSQLSFTIDDPTSVQNSARAEAIEKAKEKAKAIAKAGGFGLGRLLSIEEGGYTPVPYYRYGVGGADAKLESLPSPSIEPGSQDVTINVTLRYEIQ